MNSNRERHYQFDINCLSKSRTHVGQKTFLEEMEFAKGKVDEISLDYCWYQHGYYNIQQVFYSSCLPELCKLLSQGGKIVLPLARDSFQNLVKNLKDIQKRFHVTFWGDEEGKKSYWLRKAGGEIDEQIWQQLGKNQNQQNMLGITERDIIELTFSQKEQKDAIQLRKTLQDKLATDNPSLFIVLKKKQKKQKRHAVECVQ